MMQKKEEGKEEIEKEEEVGVILQPYCMESIPRPKYNNYTVHMLT